MKSKDVAEFDELFAFAEKEFGVHWNAADKLFFNHVLPYTSFREMQISDIGDDIACNDNEIEIPWDKEKSCEENWVVRNEFIDNISKETIMALPNDCRVKAELIIIRFMESLGVKKLLFLCK